MCSFKTFSMVAWLAVGSITGIALIDSPMAGTQRANAASVQYFTKLSDANAFAAEKRRQGYFATVLKTSGGLYRVEWYSKH